MIEAAAAYKLVENFAPGTWVAISGDEEVIASDTDFDVLHDQIKGWDNANPPLIFCVPQPGLTWIL